MNYRLKISRFTFVTTRNVLGCINVLPFHLLDDVVQLFMNNNISFTMFLTSSIFGNCIENVVEDHTRALEL